MEKKKKKTCAENPATSDEKEAKRSAIFRDVKGVGFHSKAFFFFVFQIVSDKVVSLVWYACALTVLLLRKFNLLFSFRVKIIFL